MVDLSLIKTANEVINHRQGRWGLAVVAAFRRIILAVPFVRKDQLSQQIVGFTN